MGLILLMLVGRPSMTHNFVIYESFVVPFVFIWLLLIFYRTIAVVLFALLRIYTHDVFQKYVVESKKTNDPPVLTLKQKPLAYWALASLHFAARLKSMPWGKKTLYARRLLINTDDQVVLNQAVMECEKTPAIEKRCV